jgi:peptide/nickel transport system substrate-binding protein
MMSTKRRISSARRRIAVGATSAVLLLAACSGGGETDQDAVTSEDLVSQMDPASGEVDVVKWNLDTEPETLDPANAGTPASGTVVRNLCDSLLTVDADYNLSPNIVDYEITSPTEIVFTMRADATFWDGSPVTAEDVAYTLQRNMNPEYLSAFIFSNVKSAQVTGAEEVTVTMKQPDSLFLNQLPIIAVTQKRFTEQAGDQLGTPSGGLMCSGPFKLDDWTSGQSLTMSRNEDYWDPDRIPLARTVEFSFISDAVALAQALDAGEIDGGYEISSSSVPSLEQSDAGRIVYGPSMKGTYLYVANPGGVLGDLKVREALQVAVDRESLAEVVYHGAAAPLYAYLTPATWPNDQVDAFQAAYDELAEKRAYDPETAKELVEESTYDGTPIVIGIQAGDETSSRTAQLVQQQGKAIGLNVEIKPLQPLVFNEAGYDATKREGLDLLLSYSFNAAHDPVEPLGYDYLPGSPYNYTNYDDPEVTELLNDARRSFDDAERAQMLIEAQAIYEESHTKIPLVSNYTTLFLNDDLGGAVTSLAYWSMPALAFVGSAD